jgi:Cu/Ag efflux protein CusF
MIKTVALMGALALSTSLSFAAQDVVSAVDGTVKKIDTGTKTVRSRRPRMAPNTRFTMRRRDC